MKSYTFILIITSCLLVFSCGTSMYDKMKPISGEVWNMNNPVKFDIDIQDTKSPYDFYITLRHSNDYKYSNLYLFVSTTTPKDSTKQDTLQFILADEQGNWLGNGNGSYKSYEFLTGKSYVFVDPGLYSFEFRHAMRDTVLQGISDIGIRIVPSK